MKNIREIKSRILSVQKTQKITRAMKMVSVAKFKRAEKAVKKSNCYLSALENVVTELMNRMEPDIIPVFFQNNKSDKRLIIVVSADRGLCGGFNQMVLKEANKLVRTVNNGDKVFAIGKKAIRFFEKKAIKIQKDIKVEEFIDEYAQSFAEDIVNMYKNKIIGEVILVFTEFKSMLANKVITKKILPIMQVENDHKQIFSDYLYEPEKGVIDDFIKEYVSFVLLEAVLESRASEEAARMNAMDSATENAHDLIKNLLLIYNRNRQAMITQEIAEIVSGVEALA